MADYDFYIYSDRSKLRDPSTTEYRVQRVLSHKELKPALKSCIDTLNSEGAQSVFKNFDKIFSLIEYIDQVDYGDLHYAFEKIIVKNLNIIGSFFSSYGDIEDIPLDLRHQFINIIKMSIYLFVEFIESFNTKLDTDYKILLLETKGSNKKQDMIQKHIIDYDWDWDEKLCSGFIAIYTILEYNITQLYDPPYIDHVLVSYVADCCCTQLEIPSIALVRSKPLRDSIMQILTIFITDYDYGQQFKVKVVKLLKLFEHLSIPLAKTVIKIVESGSSWSSLIQLIVQEIGDSGFTESLKETSNRDVNAGKSISSFLVEIAKHYPTVLLSNVEHLLQCLDSDPYTLRICVLSILKEIVISVLNNDELEEEEKKARDNFIFILKDHSFDINAFVRSKALQLLAAIASCDCLPVGMYGSILDLAEDKLHDKSAYVIKSAIQLVKSLIKLNPYSYDFSEEVLQSSIDDGEKMYEEIKTILASREISRNLKNDWKSIKTSLKTFLEKKFENYSSESFDEPQIITNMELPDVIMNIKKNISQCQFKFALKLILQGKETFKNEQLFNFRFQNKENLSKQFYLLFKDICFAENIMTQDVSNDKNKIYQMADEQLNEKMVTIKSQVKFLQEYDKYSSTMRKSLNSIKHLLFGDVVSASIEAIDLFTIAHEFNVLHAQEGINSMLGLINSSDKNVKETMVNSYKTIYLTVKDDDPQQAVTKMIRLVNLVKHLSVDDRKSFTILLNEWMISGTLNDDCINVLWSWFTKTTVIQYEDRVAATLLLSLLVSTKPSILNGYVDSLIEFGLYDDYHMFIYTCQMLIHIEDDDFRIYPESLRVVNQALKITGKCFYETDVELFNGVATSAITVIYKLAAKPDAVCFKLINKLYESIVTASHGKDQPVNKDIDGDTNLVAKCIFVVAQVALGQSEYLEDYVSKELIQVIKSKYEVKKSKMEGNSDMDFHDSEAAEIDQVNNRIRLICNKQLVTGRGILSFFTEDIINACNSNNLDLKANGCVALVKFMMVSAQFCKRYLPLFIELLENSENVSMTVDLITGFDWLIFKHPNLLEPVADKLYAKLDDKRIEVRYSALMTIIYLLNQEMVKVKGQVAGIAKLLVDDDERIRYNAKQFFKVIAVRGNTLYNVISDIISVLSNPEDMVSENDFIVIMKFLLPFINKDRQVESLVDKLCVRLKECTNDIQAYYVSYCLVIIKYTDKSLTKLLDNLPGYSDQLKNSKVYNNFNQIISSNSRMAKPLIKEIVSELTSKIEKIVQDEDFTVQLSQKTPGKSLTTAKKKPPKSTVRAHSSEDENEPLQVRKQSARTRSKVKRKLIVTDSEEEENNEEFAHMSGVSNVQRNTQNLNPKSNNGISELKLTQTTVSDSATSKKTRCKSSKS